MRTRNLCPVMVGVTAFWVMGFAGIQPAAAGFPAENVSLHSHIDLATFGASSGNDCWGYVSPSGREYALMGLANKVAFVEITAPANPDWFASINHASNLWGDVKVYADVAYAVTERSGTGIQVIDMSDIDNHVVTLVRTITSPGRNHNVAIDTDSGFLYTCGSRGGSGTTVIFDLSNPTNPVQVGTWQGAYEHDAQIVTYTSGPNAGRQIMFGASEGRGLDIVDVTDKSNTFLVSRTPYPNVAYCHQVWTEDLQHLYINDELDSISRTTVFDISDLENPTPVGEFSSGLGAIDHNNYVRGGFLYEANYRSGLRIYDVGSDPINPTQVGWFDTFPANDNNGFEGAWSCYPFFPSGTVIISDMNDGLFIVDVSAAINPECNSNAFCNDGLFCNGLEVCAGGECVPGGDPCPGMSCNEGLNQCVACVADGDCDDGQDCTTDTCEVGTCVMTEVECPMGQRCDFTTGQCEDFCLDDDDCPGELVCDSNIDVCVECVANEACVDGLNCTNDACVLGTCSFSPVICIVGERCDPADGQCKECLGNEDCPPDLTCDTLAGECVSCVDDTSCDDGVWCNGAERCVGGECEAGANPCPGQFCDEVARACVDCLEDAHCDDGVWCNGVERCEAGVCGAANQEACPGQSCNEDMDECVQCLFDFECDDDIFCNGSEVCDSGMCGSGVAPCPEPSCVESERRCVECLEDGDCETGGFCLFVTCGGDGDCVDESRLYGDGNRDGTVDLADILCVLDGFQGDFTLCSYEDLDIAGCESVGEPIDLVDILAVLDAFEGSDPCCGGS